MKQENSRQQQDEDGFVRPNYKGKGNRRQGKPPTMSNLKARNRAEGWGNPKQGKSRNKKGKRKGRQMNMKQIRL